MAAIRYPQFCALARAAEVVGERWSLLVLRELLLSPRRFTDLRARLDGISPSILTGRLERLEAAGLIAQTALEPPAASIVYELTPDGRALEPAILELIRWGARLLLPARPRERVDPAWIALALRGCARRTPTPPASFMVRMPDGHRDTVVAVWGGRRGTQVAVGERRADLTITAAPQTILALMSGVLSPPDAVRSRRAKAQGKLAALRIFPSLFDIRVGRSARS
jgi:DNA-binding HxlR family transcriptional regulator